MFGLQILDVALGLMFVYLTLALVCTALNETVATLLRARSRLLHTGVRHLLSDPKFRHPDGADRSLLARFYDHSLIKALYEGQAPRGNETTGRELERARPSYIPGPTFAAVVLDIVAPATEEGVRTMRDIRRHVAALPADSDLRRTLLVLMDEAGDDVTKLHHGIEVWFDHAMDRVSGWYKRRVHLVTLGIALAVTIITNADTIRIAHVLATDPQELTALLQQVERVYLHGQGEAVPATTTALAEDSVAPAPLDARLDTLKIQTTHLNATIADLRNTGLPLGWKLGELPVSWQGNANEHWQVWLVRKVAGLMVTTLAVAMGAPFWFDLLNRVMTVRGVGARPRPRKPRPAASPQS